MSEAGGWRRHGKHHAIVRRQGDALLAEAEGRDALALRVQRAQGMIEPDDSAFLGQPGERRIDEGAAEPVGGDQGSARVTFLWRACL